MHTIEKSETFHMSGMYLSHVEKLPSSKLTETKTLGEVEMLLHYMYINSLRPSDAYMRR